MIFTKKTLLKYRVQLYSIFIVLILIVIYSAYISMHSFFLFSPTQKIVGVAGLILTFFGIGSAYFYMWFTKKFNKKIDGLINNINGFKLGIAGKNIVNEELHKILDDKQFNIKPNFKFKDKNFDIDFLVIGPKGLILFEVKNYSYKLKFFDNFVSYISGGVERQADKDPRVALGFYADYLKNYLLTKGFKNLLINKAVIIPDKSKVKIATDKTGVYIICGVEGIKEYLDGLKEDPQYDATFCHKLEKVLDFKV